MKKQQNFIDMDNAREDSQRQVMAEIQEKDHCPFCLENFRNYHPEPFIKENGTWLVVHNRWPYKNTQHHLLIILKRHIEMVTELTDSERVDLFALVDWLVEKYKIPGGGLVMRFGDTNFSAGSVNHLHAQLIVPDANKKDFESVKVTLGKSWHKRK